MNVFVLDLDPRAAAHMLCDQHVGKMLIEAVQILSTVAHGHGLPAPYRPTHRNHPVVLWADEPRANWWLARHADELGREHQNRYRRFHKTALAAYDLPNTPDIWPGVGGRDWTSPPESFVQCMPENYRGDDPVEAYRRYYRAEKAGFARWERGTPAPDWWSHAEEEVGRGLREGSR